MFKERKHRKAYLEIFSTNETVGVGGVRSLLTPLMHVSNFAICILWLCIHSLEECRKHVRHVHWGVGDSVYILHTERKFGKGNMFGCFSM